MAAVDRAAALALIRREQRGRRNLSLLYALRDEPHDFGSIAAGASSAAPLTMPAEARLAISCSVGLDASDVTITISGGLDFSHPALAANEVHRGNLAEADKVVSITRGAGAPAGTLTLYMIDAFGRHLAIGTATFT